MLAAYANRRSPLPARAAKTLARARERERARDAEERRKEADDGGGGGDEYIESVALSFASVRAGRERERREG